MMRWLIPIMLVLLVGCTDTATPHKQESNADRVESADGRVLLETHIDRASIRTIDQLDVTVRVSRAQDAQAKLNEPDWESDGWTLLNTQRGVESLVDDRFVQTITYTIEPFLDGEYLIPAMTLQLSDTQLASDPVAITVRSVLDADDPGELNASLDLLAPEDLPLPDPGFPIGIAAVGGVIVAACIFWFIGRNSTTPVPSPTEQLQRVADGRCADHDEAMSIVHRAIESIADSEDAEPIRTICETNRFGGSNSKDADPVDLAEQTLLIMRGVS